MWDDLCFLVDSISEESFNFSGQFLKKKSFGVTDILQNMITAFVIFFFKFYIHRCKFQESDLSFVAFMNLVKTIKKY